jgi:hypothetical protein
VVTDTIDELTRKALSQGPASKLSPAAAARSRRRYQEEWIMDPVAIALVSIAIPIWLWLVIRAWRDQHPRGTTERKEH